MKSLGLPRSICCLAVGVLCSCGTTAGSDSGKPRIRVVGANDASQLNMAPASSDTCRVAALTRYPDDAKVLGSSALEITTEMSAARTVPLTWKASGERTRVELQLHELSLVRATEEARPNMTTLEGGCAEGERDLLVGRLELRTLDGLLEVERVKLGFHAVDDAGTTRWLVDSWKLQTTSGATYYLSLSLKGGQVEGELARNEGDDRTGDVAAFHLARVASFGN